MALSVIGPWSPVTHGSWVQPIASLEAIALRTIVQSDQGVCQGYSAPDGRIWAGALITPSAAKIAADGASASAVAAVDTKRAAALTVVRNQVARVKAIAPASRTEQDRWLLSLTYLCQSEE